MFGEFGNTKVIRKFGDVPEDLSGARSAVCGRARLDAAVRGKVRQAAAIHGIPNFRSNAGSRGYKRGIS